MAKVYTKWCKQCYHGFTSTRDDAVFCEPKCAAQWARDHGEFRTRYHEEKEEQIRKECAFCGHGFWHNEYAERAGKRVPQYCSNKCRQAAYRARKGANAGYAGNWDDARNDKTKGESAKRAKGESAKKDTSQKKEEPKKDTSQNSKDTQHDARWSSNDPRVVLGVTYLNTKEEVKAAWKKLLRKYHPDINKHPSATWICQMINSAWGKLERVL